MEARIYERLRPLRRRRRMMLLVRWAALGLLAGSLAGIAAGGLRWAGFAIPGSWAVFGGIAAMTAIGGAIGWIRGRDWASVAAAVDAGYDLKDRAVTALAFAGRPEADAIRSLQMADADEHLAGIDPRRVVPYRLSGTMVAGLAAAVLAAALLFVPRPGEVRASAPEPLETVVAAAEEARASVEELREEARHDREIEALVARLIEKVEEMQKPGVDVKEALAKLSEMQAAIAAEQARYDVGRIDAQMKALGEALASSPSFEAAGQALQESKYDKAAELLEKAEPRLDPKEARELRERLQKAAGAMGGGALGEASSAMAEALGDGSSADAALKKLGKLARDQGRRRQLNDLLTLQCRDLSECKGNCNKSGGLRLKTAKTSSRPSSNWKRGVNGNLDGEPTPQEAVGRTDQITGKPGEGPSETETVQSPEGRGQASRAYREAYQKYRKMSEAALDGEAIPLGHRETIRRYFELIRPAAEGEKN